MAAVREIFLNFIMVIKISSHKIIKTINPPGIECPPKKTTGHNTLKMSCIIKSINAVLTSLFFKPSFHIRKREIPISKYNTTHTGAISQSGGLNDGLFKDAYQPD